MISYWKLINNMLVYICVHKLNHFQPHSLLCHLWCLLFAMHSFLYDIFIYDHFKSWRSSFDKLFFFHTQFIYHIANQLHQHSNISRTIASSQHHPRETRPLLSQPNLYKIFYIGMSYDEIVLYITRNESIYFFIRFLFLSFLFLFYINSSQSICLFFFFP